MTCWVGGTKLAVITLPHEYTQVHKPRSKLCFFVFYVYFISKRVKYSNSVRWATSLGCKLLTHLLLSAMLRPCATTARSTTDTFAAERRAAAPCHHSPVYYWRICCWAPCCSPVLPQPGLLLTHLLLSAMLQPRATTPRLPATGLCQISVALTGLMDGHRTVT